MGKKYLDTKKSSLESSILGVWENAVSETVERAKANLDARTKEYKVHQEKLASARLRRENLKKVTKEEVDLDEGKVIFDDHDDEDDDFIALTKKLGLKFKTKGDETTVSGSDANIAKMLKTMKMKKDTDGHAMLEKLDEGTKAEYQKFFNAAMKKFKIDSPADLKSDEEKKKFFDYVDKNYKGEKDEDFESRLKETIGIKESFEIGTNEYRDHALKVTPGETDPEWEQARDFKVASMKEALAKVWGMEEGNNPFIKKEDDDKALTKDAKSGKTMTGKKVAIIDTKPKIKD